MAKRKKYNEDKLVELLSNGKLSHREIAQIVGISNTFVSKIARGAQRMDLYDRIVHKPDNPLGDTMSFGRSWIKNVLTKQVQIAMTDTETARKCREYILDHFMFGDHAHADLTQEPEPDLEASLSNEIGEFYKWKSLTLGGPQSTEAGK